MKPISIEYRELTKELINGLDSETYKARLTILNNRSTKRGRQLKLFTALPIDIKKLRIVNNGVAWF